MTIKNREQPIIGSVELRRQVEDNGIGFEERHLGRIVRPFQRLHDQKSRYKGTGINPAVCRKVAERHGGTTGNTPGKGSTFTLTLPVKRPAG